LNKVCSYKTIGANTIESEFSLLDESPHLVGGVATNWGYQYVYSSLLFYNYLLLAVDLLLVCYTCCIGHCV